MLDEIKTNHDLAIAVKKYIAAHPDNFFMTNPEKCFIGIVYFQFGFALSISKTLGCDPKIIHVQAWPEYIKEKYGCPTSFEFDRLPNEVRVAAGHEVLDIYMETAKKFKPKKKLGK